MLAALGALVREVRQVEELAGLEGLVIPGGESTTMAKLMDDYGLLAPIRTFGLAGHPIYGSCAGLIALSKSTVEGGQPTLGLMDIVVRRNAFGRQLHSFEADLDLSGIGGGPLRAVFIRAPWIEEAGPAVRVLARHEGHIVAAEERSLLATAFHPELTGDARVHAYFLEMVQRSRD